MKGCAEMMAQDTQAAINLVEAAFPNEARVRSARRMFTKAANARPFAADAMVQAYIELVQSVAVAVGCGEKIDRFDVESGYYPRALGVLDEAAIVEAERKIADHAAGVRQN